MKRHVFAFACVCVCALPFCLLPVWLFWRLTARCAICKRADDSGPQGVESDWKGESADSQRQKVRMCPECANQRNLWWLLRAQHGLMKHSSTILDVMDVTVKTAPEHYTNDWCQSQHLLCIIMPNTCLYRLMLMEEADVIMRAEQAFTVNMPKFPHSMHTVGSQFTWVGKHKERTAQTLHFFFVHIQCLDLSNFFLKWVGR